jgi:hypothetical protein
MRCGQERSGNGFRLSGRKQFVVQGASADFFVVAAKAEEGVTLFTVDKDARGLEVEGVRLADSSIGARLDFNGVEVDADAVIGEVGQGEAVLGRVLRAGRAGAASEMVGVGSAAMDMTVDYMKQRKQFGRLIGEFQVLQHRSAHPLLRDRDRPRRCPQGSAAPGRRQRRGRSHGLRRQGKGRAGLDARRAGRRTDAWRHGHDRRI